MGVFLQTAIIPDCKEAEAREAVERVAQKLSCEKYEITDLIPEECQFKVQGKGISILFNEDCVGYEFLAEAISKEAGKAVLLLYIYDDDFWGYFLYENGSQIDQFNPMPDCLEEVSEEERQEMKGNAKAISEYFHVEEALIEKYLVYWTEEMLEGEETKAYEEDEFVQCDCWQLADFMRKLGYPYEWGE